MAAKTYDQKKAMDPGQEQQAGTGDDINFQELVSELPKEFQAEIADALAALLTYVHSDDGTTKIIDDLRKAKGNEAAQVGITALQIMDMVDPEHKWTDSAKVFAGYFAVHEVALIGREAGIVKISKDEEGKIFEQAAQNYLHALIKNKPTQREREAEAIRIQKEVDPLVQGKMREAAHSAAKENGIATADDQQGGLLE